MPAFQPFLGIRGKRYQKGGLKMVTITNTTVTREQVWTAFRRTPDGWVRERYHAILLLTNGKSCPEAVRWLYRDEETIPT